LLLRRLRSLFESEGLEVELPAENIPNLRVFYLFGGQKGRIGQTGGAGSLRAEIFGLGFLEMFGILALVRFANLAGNFFRIGLANFGIFQKIAGSLRIWVACGVFEDQALKLLGQFAILRRIVAQKASNRLREVVKVLISGRFAPFMGFFVRKVEPGLVFQIIAGPEGVDNLRIK